MLPMKSLSTTQHFVPILFKLLLDFLNGCETFVSNTLQHTQRNQKYVRCLEGEKNYFYELLSKVILYSEYSLKILV